MHIPVQVRLVQQNGEILEKPSRHVLLVDSTRIKLSKNRSTKVKEEYSSIVQVLSSITTAIDLTTSTPYWVVFLLLQENATEPQDMWFCTMVCLGFRVHVDWINHLLQIIIWGLFLQLCGARGGGQAAARALYWVPNKGLSLMLVLESERERNAAIMLARRFACDQNVSCHPKLWKIVCNLERCLRLWKKSQVYMILALWLTIISNTRCPHSPSPKLGSLLNVLHNITVMSMQVTLVGPDDELSMGKNTASAAWWKWWKWLFYQSINQSKRAKNSMIL